MEAGRRLPDDAVEFIRRCVGDRKIYWTYHVNMRLAGRHLTREELVGAAASYEIIEAYPEDKYLPSYLVRATAADRPFHVCSAPTWKATTCES